MATEKSSEVVVSIETTRHRLWFLQKK